MQLIEDIKVSVCMITYKHEQFIKEAIEGVLMQQVDFNVELIVADDHSPDRTEQLVLELAQNHPKGHWIRYTKHQHNKGMMANFIWSLEQCEGKYIALCEGDDYWTDPLKLQKQVNFLENNPEVNLCGHYASVLNGNEMKKPEHIYEYELGFRDIGGRNFSGIRTQTLMYRNNIDYPDWLYSVYGDDRAVLFLNALKGKIKMLAFNGAVYRVHSGGNEQQYKKDKFALPARNIIEDQQYYKLTNFTAHKQMIFKRLIKNHLYIMFWALPKLRIRFFMKYTWSLILLKKTVS